MRLRAALTCNGQRALRWQTISNSRRCLTNAALGSFSYETGDAGGVKFASRDLLGPTTHLAVVAKAGTRYQPLPGFSEGLEKFSFKVCLRCIGGLRMTSNLTRPHMNEHRADCFFFA